MKFVIQRVKESSVKVDGEYTGKIKKGYLVLIGVGQEDTKEEADKYIRKMINLRIFEDENGKTNCSLKDVDGELLLVSQFTLYANCRKGIVQVLHRLEIQRKQKNYMSISLTSAARK